MRDGRPTSFKLAGTHVDNITAETIKEYATIPLRREVEGMLSAALTGNFRDARDRLFAMFVEREPRARTS